jgi:Xaa-Pro aminopeptidase
MYPHQAERLTAALEAGGLEALVAVSPASVAYVTGFWSLAGAGQPAGDIYAVVARGGTALVVPTMEAAAAVDGGAEADHVVCHGRFAYEYGPGESARRLREIAAEPAAGVEDALAAALACVGVRGGKIGLDDATLPAARAAALGRRLKGYTLTSATEALAIARRIKSPYEIDALQKVLHISEESLDAVLDLMRPGVTELEVATAFEHAVAGRGGACYRTIVAFGAGAAVPAPWPTDRALRKGDLVRFDLGCVARGYRSNVARMAVLGDPSSRQQAVFDALHAGLEALVEGLRPAAKCADVFAAGLTAVRKAGLTGYDRHHMGHAIGLDPVEAPWISSADGALEMGMVICAETPYYVVGEAGFTVTETTLVTRSGAHVLNRSQRGLVVLD